MENKMKYELKHDYIIVRFCGEMDCVNAPYYRHQLNTIFEENSGNVIFDFSNITFIDSSGIGLVLGRYNQLRFDNRQLILTGLNKVSYNLFELTGLFQIMPYYQTIEEAIKREE